MRCQFEGPFTVEEQRCIRARLHVMDAAADLLQLDLGQEWRLQHAPEEEGRDAYLAYQVESGVVFWAPTACQLGREIDKAATFLMVSQGGDQDA